MFLNKQSIIESAGKFKALFLDLIFPIECLSCGKEGEWLCEKCFRKLKFKPAQYCLHCKKENKLGEFCLACRTQYALDGVWIAGVYEEQIIANLVKSLKYRFTQDVAKDLGRFLCLFLRDLINKSRIGRADLVSGVDWRKLGQVSGHPNVLLNFSENLIMQVPLANKRKRWRGFNQAEVIACEIANHFKLEIRTDKLVRIKHKKPQAKLGERERKKNIVGCFAWNGSDLAGQNIIIVDDVVTTGSTLNECAKVLKQNGAGEIWGLVVAKG